MSGECPKCLEHPVDCKCYQFFNIEPDCSGNAISIGDGILYSDPINDSNTINEILFCMDNHDWIMKITDNGIFFNREKFTDFFPDDFAKAVIEILENGEYVMKKNNNIINNV